MAEITQHRAESTCTNAHPIISVPVQFRATEELVGSPRLLWRVTNGTLSPLTRGDRGPLEERLERARPQTSGGLRLYYPSSNAPPPE